MTLIELIVAVAIMMILTSMALPLAAMRVRREKERHLRAALDEIRHAIDQYKDHADKNEFGPLKVGTEGYPESLEILVEGVKIAQPARQEGEIFAQDPARSDDQHLREWGKRSIAGRSEIHILGQSERVRCLHYQLREGSRWDTILGVVMRLAGKPASSSRAAAFYADRFLIVVSIVGILVSMAIPIYQKSLIRTKEGVLRQNLFSLRTQIDEYTYDRQKAPQTLQDLVTGYLRAVPVDPMTGASDKWITVMENSMRTVSQNEPGIFGVHSGSDQKSLEGTLYADW